MTRRRQDGEGGRAAMRPGPLFFLPACFCATASPILEYRRELDEIFILRREHLGPAVDDPRGCP